MKLQDPWSDWLFKRRHGKRESSARRIVLPSLERARDRILAAASLVPGERVLDVGTGDGLLAFDALPDVSPGGSVLGTDLSHAAVDRCRGWAEEYGLNPPAEEY